MVCSWISRQSSRRRAAAVFFVVILIPVLLGFGALTIDVGVLVNTRADLQNAADAGALAAGEILAQDRSAAGVERAREAALEVIQRHWTLGQPLSAAPGDLVFGRAQYDEATNQFSFSPTENFPNAVRVVVERTSRSPNGAAPLFFAPIFGKRTADVSASATAALGGSRDIAVVIDLTWTMNYDSQFLHAFEHEAENGDELPGTQINLRDIWCAIDGPAPSRPYLPGDEDETEFASDTGPTIGTMNTWGSAITPETYNPTTDPGLWYIPRNSTITTAAIRTSIMSNGYSNDEATQLMSSSQDGSYSNQWRNRVAAITGLARWRSGRSGGTPGGDGDTRVEDGELTWAAVPTYAAGWTWTDYITYVASNSSYLYDADSDFRYRFGLKTFTSFLLEMPAADETSILWQTPEQPLQAIKDAVQTFVNVLTDAEGGDLVSLESFDNVGRHHIDLTDDYQSIADRLYQFQAAHYEKTTNLGAGIAKGIEELTSNRGRDNSAKMIIVLSDGQPNTNENGFWAGYGSSVASGYAIAQAHEAADEGIRIVAITVGWDANRELMQQLAEITGGREFQAAGDPQEYTEALQQIFFMLGTGDDVMLIE